MSVSSPPRSGSVDKTRAKKRDRPPALELNTPDTRLNLEQDFELIGQPRVEVSLAQPHDSDVPRSASAASSSLDAYYYTSPTPGESPVPPSLPVGPITIPRTPELPASLPPTTPARNPATIDRRGLVGVGELTTPRWTRYEHAAKHGHNFDPAEGMNNVAEVDELAVDDDEPERETDSPWTIEAVDEPKDDIIDEKPSPPRAIRARASMASESGGEEILYPRKVANPDVFHQPSFSPPGARVPANHTTPSRRNAESPAVGSSPSTAGSYAQFGTPITAKQRRPRTSDAETDSSGVFSPKPASSTPKDRLKEDASASARKHRSLGLGMGGTSLTPREKGARESSALGGSSVGRSSSTKHSRSSSSSSQAKRGHVADYSHLPPSPSSTSHHPAVKHAPTGSTSSPLHVTSAVAHSLLRGTQEGWSAMDDEATTEALRKLDGVSGKSPHARARTSIGSRPNSISRPSSRPGTPGAVRGAQWEGIAAFEGGGRSSRSSKKASSGDERRTSTSSKLAPAVNLDDEFSSEGQNSSEKPSATKKRSSIIASKRGSTPSTSYTGTTTASSRDSGSMSVGTSLTSVSANSHRHSLKAQRNSAGSDISAHSSEVASLRDRAAALVSTHDVFELEHVPPVPPLPKDLSNFRSPPHSTTSVHFPTIPMPSEEEADADRTVSMDAAPDAPSSPAAHALSPVSPPPAKIQESSAPSHVEVQPAPKTPSKKWSFNLKLSSSPAASRDSTSKAINGPISSSAPSNAMSPRLAAKRSMDAWSQPEAMGSAASLGSLSSVGSVQGSPAASLAPSFTITSSPDHVQAPSNPAGRTSTDQASGGLAPSQTPLSPSSSLRRGTSTRRLTPSSIPFFRRSSSQAAQPQSENEQSTSPSVASPMKKTSTRLRVKSTISPTDASLSSPATPGSTQKKSSVLSLGFLRGSSSRKSLQSDREQADVKAERESRRLTKEAEKLAEKDRKKDEKDRSESRISVLMGRKRGKTLSSSDPQKAKAAVAMPPLQVGALSSATVQRVANLNSSVSTPVSSVSSRPAPSRVTSQTISSMHKHSDTSLRSSRNQLPTIAGSPSVATAAESSNGGFKEPSLPPPSSLNVSTSLPRETPTKIPRMAGQSGIPSPTLKGSVSSVSTVTARRTSLNSSSLAPSAAPSINNVSPSPGTGTTKEDGALDEFGVLSSTGDTTTAKNVAATPTHRLSVRASPSMTSTSSRVPRQVSAPVAAASTRKNRESLSFAGLRKASTSSVTSLSSAAAQSDAPSQTQSHSRFSALSPSKGLKLLTPKISLSGNRHNSTNSSSSTAVAGSAASSRQSLSTPSPVPSSVDDEEQQGDDEMLQCVRRQQAKKLSSGATQEELDEMFKIPEPLPPVKPTTPAELLRSSQVKYLSEYERKEVLDFEKVYFFGARSQKKYATLDNSTNNHGYDDDRGDYLIVNHDHLAYRYEVVGSLGKGSFGQVLKCRDHATGEFVAIKIIRNKKRFHHQALVEIKILDNLRKWDPEDKHQVIQMIEHFTFRGHLCIAMELLSMNLYELIKANGFVGFSTTLVRRFTNQMLLSLSLMRHHRIVHCDLKPENVLLKHASKSAIKVIDFGSSCLEHEKIYTYIQSRFYRSPEVIMGMNYHMAIDMWSLGCIMAELYTGFPIFPGENEQEQLSCIMEVLGVPDKDFINRSSRKKLFFDASGTPRPVVNSKGRRRRPGTKTLAQVLRSEDELFVDFIAKCLTWDPERRIKPQQALRHPFILPQRRPRVLSPVSGAARSLLSSASSSVSSSSRSKPADTPKKSQIGAPTPLTSRISRTSSSAVSSTPLASSSTTTLGSSSRSYRASQSQTFSTHYSSKTMSSFTAGK